MEAEVNIAVRAAVARKLGFTPQALVPPLTYLNIVYVDDF